MPCSSIENRIARIEGIEAVGTGAPMTPLIAGRRTKPDAGIDADTRMADRGSAEDLHQSGYPRFPRTGRSSRRQRPHCPASPGYQGAPRYPLPAASASSPVSGCAAPQCVARGSGRIRAAEVFPSLRRLSKRCGIFRFPVTAQRARHQGARRINPPSNKATRVPLHCRETCTPSRSAAIPSSIPPSPADPIPTMTQRLMTRPRASSSRWL